MACGLSKSLGLSSSMKKQGIVTILGGDYDSDISSNTSAASLRRTFSADLSKSWLSRNGFCPMKTISSSEELHASVADEEGGGEELISGFDIWAQIQNEKKNNKIDDERPGQSGVWSSILSQKSEPIKMVPPPYVHPIVKRASSSLNEKSLEICTESLGSETGSDVFSRFPSPGKRDAEEQKEEDQSEAEQETWVPNHNLNSTIVKKSLGGGSFPPPIPSLSSQSGKSLHMKTRRDNGRLVLEAVSMASQNNFCAKRQDGRLVLTFTDPKDETNDSNEREEDEEEETLWFNEEEEPRNGLAGVYNFTQNPNGLANVHRLAHKPIGIPIRNPRWPCKDEPSGKSDVLAPVAQSLPPRPKVAKLARAAQPPSTVDDTVGAACFNTYDYYWRPIKPMNPTLMGQFQAQDSVKGKDGLLNGCKEQRRSLLFFEPFCIATS
ncbi:PREDICTED: protein FAF-like, chloroplastic [Tarenaya hassleriana]|uniref:protein FAF-like, chloroplastic n=1 Tax=Tarenaya hassleriana TaxID=28532 RepID=UPI00053C66BA|nr:PREDICTED: protein FAF-like, chloroplastic [Tarenaya hassleriana]